MKFNFHREQDILSKNTIICVNEFDYDDCFSSAVVAYTTNVLKVSGSISEFEQLFIIMIFKTFLTEFRCFLCMYEFMEKSLYVFISVI